MRHRLIAAALVAAFLFPEPTAAQIGCGPRTQVEADIAAQDLRIVAEGEDLQGMYFWWLANARTGLWAIFMRPAGMPDVLCLMTMGTVPLAQARDKS